MDPKREISALVHKLASFNRYPMVFFPNSKGSKFPVVCNLHADRKKMALALETTEENLIQGYLKRIRNPIPLTLVSDGPVKELVMKERDVDLTRFPIVTHCRMPALISQ